MKRLRVEVFVGGRRFERTVHGDKSFTVGTARSLPDITVDDDNLPPVLAIAQFVDGQLFWVHHMGWLLETDANGDLRVVRNSTGAQLRPAVDGKLAFCFQSVKDGECRIVLTVQS